MQITTPLASLGQYAHQQFCWLTRSPVGSVGRLVQSLTAVKAEAHQVFHALSPSDGLRDAILHETGSPHTWLWETLPAEGFQLSKPKFHFENVFFPKNQQLEPSYLLHAQSAPFLGAESFRLQDVPHHYLGFDMHTDTDTGALAQLYAFMTAPNLHQELLAFASPQTTDTPWHFIYLATHPNGYRLAVNPEKKMVTNFKPWVQNHPVLAHFLEQKQIKFGGSVDPMTSFFMSTQEPDDLITLATLVTRAA